VGGEDARCGRYGILNRGMTWGDQTGGGMGRRIRMPPIEQAILTKQFSPFSRGRGGTCLKRGACIKKSSIYVFLFP
jgi:hypothetical protein